MNINELKQAYKIITDMGGVPFVTARPGVGKSDSVLQYAANEAKSLGLELAIGPENYHPNKYNFIDLRLATVDSIDLGGLPLIDKEVSKTRFTRSPYIPEDGHGILFLDELPQAKAGNQAAVSQLILDKRVGSHALGRNWKIIAAGNRSEDRAATHKMPTHVANRLVHLELDFSLDAFVQYMINQKVDDMAIAFAKFRSSIFESFKPDQDINCTPRSYISSMKFIDAGDNLMYPLIAGTIGEGPAAEFTGFYKIYKNLPELDEFLAKPKTIDIPRESDVLFACIQMLSLGTTPDNIDKIAKFIDRLEDTPERQVQYYRNACSKDPSVASTKPFQEFVSNNKDLLIG